MIYEMIYIMLLYWYDVIRIQWWLHSIMGSYGRSELEAVYGEMMIHSTEAIREIIGREKWLGCRHDASPMVDIPGSTPVWAQYILFFEFQILNFIYVLFFKIYSIMKKILVIFDIVLARRCSENVFDRPWYFLTVNENPQI